MKSPDVEFMRNLKGTKVTRVHAFAYDHTDFDELKYILAGEVLALFKIFL